ncbi:aldolase [Saccharopolyspora sp. TS4A08]|uniref:3-oxo-tetronate 4-phosphate decarboxylase n=1 Tax=Saccharopolyspora ipomoeae TaxID=3042027 RepID=A0ABT6PI91_9PSEU|nr:3-oxo-tetronate 4-phosphate decarboxylase [Saccharopolyspora sp. TS4A08]MDI2027700.1 aldolase [Saccharopolyspora sp. TS4A08]
MTDLARQVVDLGASLFARGLTAGRTGNISVRDGDRVLLTPTGVSLGALAELSVLDTGGRHLGGPPPTKEAFLHLAFYRARPQTSAVVHTHSTHSAAVSCLAGLDPSNALPPLTAYYAMRVGSLPLLPYHAPGDTSLGALAEEEAREHHALLLANHGPIAAGGDLAAAADAVEEIEETARIFLLLRNTETAPLTPDQVAALRA